MHDDGSKFFGWTITEWAVCFAQYHPNIPTMGYYMDCRYRWMRDNRDQPDPSAIKDWETAGEFWMMAMERFARLSA